MLFWILVIIFLFLFMIFLVISTILEVYRRQLHRDRKSFYDIPFTENLYNWWCGSNSTHDPFPEIEVYFPNHDLLKKNWKLIRKEALKVYKAQLTKKIQKDMFFEDIADSKWKRYYLKWYGPVLEDAKQNCPFTCSLLEQLPEVHLAMFSILEAGSKITPHYGPFKGSLRYHLGLQTPNSDQSWINLDGEKYSWRDGKDVLFDDTYLHFVENNTNKIRIILFCDVERKLNSSWKQKINNWICVQVASLTTRTN